MSTPPMDCDCRRLCRPLRGDEGLPDHVCLATMQETVRAWCREAWLGTAPLMHGLALRGATKIGWRLPTDIFAYLHEYHTLPVESRLARLEPLVEAVAGDWPLPVGTRDLGLVIRQWA